MDEKGNRVKPEERNGYKFETLVLDKLVHMMNDCIPYEGVGEKEFAPIRNRDGVDCDSNTRARELLRGNGVLLISKKRYLLFYRTIKLKGGRVMKLMHRNLAGKLTVFFAALLLMLLVTRLQFTLQKRGYYSAEKMTVVRLMVQSMS